MTASDKVASATQTFTATAKSNSGGPSLRLVIQRVALGATPKKVDLNSYASDPDGDAISYSVSSDDTSKATVSLSGLNFNHHRQGGGVSLHQGQSQRRAALYE